MKNAELIAKLEAEATEQYKNIRSKKRIDESFARPEDEPLTKEEIAAIDAYWGKYKFAYPVIDYKSFQTFKNRCGRFDVRHCPGSIRTEILHSHFVDWHYTFAFQNKGLMDYLYPDFKKPRTVFRQMAGLLFDEQFNIVDRDEVAASCCEHVRTVGNLIIKPSGAGGGRGITFLNKENAEPGFVKKLLAEEYGTRAFVIQKVMEQSPFMKALNPSSVNTIRITTLLFKGKVTPLAALVRIGSFGSEVDNWCSGGSLLGIDIETGKCRDWALANDLRHISTLSSGMDVSAQELYVPSFDRIKEQVIHAHCRMPYVKLISWDIALDQDDNPVFIECNHAGMIQIHEATTGPVFGELMDELCDEYLLKRFFIRFATEDFVCREYHDHVEIVEYIGDSSTAIVPETLRNKPVTRIERTAFRKRQAALISVSDTLANDVFGAAEVSVRKSGFSGFLSLGDRSYYVSPEKGHAIKGEWVTDEEGRRYYCSAKDGHVVKGSKVAAGGKIYYADQTGAQVTGFVDIGEKTFYFSQEDGRLRKGCFVTDGDGKTYYLSPKDGCVQKGVWVTGEDDRKYYLSPEDGHVMKSSWIKFYGERLLSKKKRRAPSA